MGQSVINPIDIKITTLQRIFFVCTTELYFDLTINVIKI